MVVHTFNFSTWETEAGGSQVQGQSGVHSKTLSQNKQKNKKPDVFKGKGISFIH
jgi:hypothetical protein